MDVLTYVKQKANLNSLCLGVGTVFAGTGAAALRGNMEVLSASICMLFVIFAQLSVHFAHNYRAQAKLYDNLPRAKYSVTAEEPVSDKLAVRVLREASFGCGVIAAMLGLTILTMARTPWWVIGVGLLIILINYLLNFGKHPLYGRPATLGFTWLLFGPVGVIGTSVLQCNHEAVHLWGYYDLSPSYFLSIAVGSMACNVHIMYGYGMWRLNPTRQARGLTYEWGPRKVEALFFINGLIALGVVFFEAFYLNFLRPLTTVAPAFITFALNTFVAARMRYVPIGELQHLNTLVKWNYILFGFVTFIVWWWVGSPDDSVMRYF